MKVLSNTKNKETAELMRLLVTIVFMISVLNLTGTHLHTPPGDIFFWFSMGCISRFYRQWREEDNLEKAAKTALEGAETESRVARNKGVRLPGSPDRGGPVHLPASFPTPLPNVPPNGLPGGFHG